jgi:hypothetical protein
MYVELFEDIVDEDGSSGFNLVISSLAYVDIFFISLIFDVSEDFFQDVLHGDDTSGSTVFVEYERDMATRLLEFFK